MPLRKKPDEIVSWYRPDLAYEHLHQIKMTVSFYAGQVGQEIGHYNSLQEEYRYVWEHIVEYAKQDSFDMKYFEKEWQTIRTLLFNPRYEMESVNAERLKIRNYGIVRGKLHNIQMLLNKYEVIAGLQITKAERPDPSRAMARYGG
tara:strand:- start:8 stop:445 length:438 start_codon:yes stop_codon:yes gene_type:complete